MDMDIALPAVATFPLIVSDTANADAEGEKGKGGKKGKGRTRVGARRGDQRKGGTHGVEGRGAIHGGEIMREGTRGVVLVGVDVVLEEVGEDFRGREKGVRGVLLRQNSP